MKDNWVRTVENVYRLGSLEDVDMAYEHINVYKGSYRFVFDPDIPMYNFDYVHEILLNDNVPRRWIADNGVKITPRFLIAAVESGDIEKVKFYCKDGMIDTKSNNMYPVLSYDGYSIIMENELVDNLVDIDNGVLSEIKHYDKGCRRIKLSNPIPEKSRCFELVAKYWKKCLGPYLVQKAVECGHLDILKYLVSEGMSDPSKNMDFSVVFDDEDLLEFLLEKGYEFSTNTIPVAMMKKDTSFLDKLVSKGAPVETSVTCIPGEYNTYQFFGSTSIRIPFDAAISNPDHGVLKWALDKGYGLKNTIDVGLCITEKRMDIFELLVEEGHKDSLSIDTRSVNGGKLMLEMENLKEVLKHVYCNNSLRRFIFQTGDVEMMEFMLENNLMEDRNEKNKPVFDKGSCIFDDSLKFGNLDVTRWAKDKGLEPKYPNAVLTSLVVDGPIRSVRWALDNGFKLEIQDGYFGERVIKQIASRKSVFDELRSRGFDFKKYAGVFESDKSDMFDIIHPDVISELEADGIRVQLPYEGVCASTNNWSFVRKWKLCKTWDKEKFLKVSMKYRDNVPEDLQAILDE